MGASGRQERIPWSAVRVQNKSLKKKLAVVMEHIVDETCPEL